MPTPAKPRLLARHAALHVFALFVLFQTPAARADEDRWYDVELLVFKHTRPENFSSEQWPQQWHLPPADNGIDVDRIGRKHRDAFKPADKTDNFEKTFSGFFENIEKARRYQPLSYLSWRQRGLDKESAVAVTLQAGNSYLPRSALQPAAPADGQNDDDNGNRIRFGIFEPVIGPDGYVTEHRIRRYSPVKTDAMIIGDKPTLHELSGTIKLVFSRFIHIYTDLLLLQPVDVVREQDEAKQPVAGLSNNPASRNPSTPSYRIEWADELTGDRTLFGFNIKSHRKMRSGELHHLDHPLVGILIQVRQAPDKEKE